MNEQSLGLNDQPAESAVADANLKYRRGYQVLDSIHWAAWDAPTQTLPKQKGGPTSRGHPRSFI